MTKLFSLENEDVLKNLEANDLLIDKVLKLANKSKDPVSLTANILKQRQELKEDIQERLNAESEEESKDDSSSEQEEKLEDISSSKSEEEPKEDSSSENDKDNSKENKEDEGKDKSNLDDSSDSTTSNDKDDEDLSSKADDKDSLKSIIGSGISNKDKDDTKSKNAAQESFSLSSKKVNFSNIFAPLRNSYNKYLASMESFNIPDRIAIEEQPIVYVKDSVLEALNNLVTIANNYISKNKTFIDSNSKSIKNVNERLTVLRQFIENRKYHFTHNLVNDHKLLTEVSVIDKSNPRETCKILVTYIKNCNKFINYVLSNDFNSISSALKNAEFISEEDDFVYKTMLPGFNIIRVHLDEYENYLKSNIENFHYYQLKTFKTEYLYNLDAIGITEDKDLDFIMTYLDKMLIDLSMSIDNFNIVNSGLNNLIDEIKVLIYDVDQDKYSNLAELDIDSKVKDFIKFKLVSETYYSSITMLLNYILNIDTVINKCIELKS